MTVCLVFHGLNNNLYIVFFFTFLHFTSGTAESESKGPSDRLSSLFISEWGLLLPALQMQIIFVKNVQFYVANYTIIHAKLMHWICG